MPITHMNAEETGPNDAGAVHDYIADIAGELAQLARRLGDNRLALLLETAATFAERPYIDRH